MDDSLEKVDTILRPKILKPRNCRGLANAHTASSPICSNPFDIFVGVFYAPPPAAVVLKCMYHF